MAGFNLSGERHNPDILTCLSNLSNDEVFTPPDMVNQILDKLPERYREALDRRRTENALVRSLRLNRPDPESWERCRIERTDL